MTDSDRRCSTYFNKFLEVSFKLLPLEYVHNHELSKFLRHCEIGFRRSKSESQLEPGSKLTWAEAGSSISTMYSFLREAVLSMELKFDSVICFPPDEIQDAIASSFLNHKKTPCLPTTADYQMLETKMKEFAREYSERNEDIQGLEHEAFLRVIEICVAHYVSTGEDKLGGFHMEPSRLDQVLEQNFKFVQSCFKSACGFKHSFWDEKYSSALQNAISVHEESYRKRNMENRELLGERLEELLLRTKEHFEKSLEMLSSGVKEEKQQLPPLLTFHDRSEYFKKYFQASMDYFEQELQLLVQGSEHPGIIENYRQKLKVSLAGSRKQNRSRRHLIFEQQQPLIQRNSLHPQIRNLHDSLGDYLILHLGLKYIRAAVFESGSDRVQTWQPEDTWATYLQSKLDWEEENVTETSFPGSFLSRSVSTTFKAQLSPGSPARVPLQFKDMIQTIVQSLRSKVEAETSRAFRKLILCVPQCLNEPQRRAITVGARLADFTTVDLIADTNALALQYITMKRGSSAPKRKKRIIVGNFKEGSFDLAWFSLCPAAGMGISCEALSGEYFIKSPPPGGYQWQQLRVSYATLEDKLVQVLELHPEQLLLAGAAAGEADDLDFIICGGNRNFARMLKNNFPALCSNGILPWDEESPVLGAAQLGIITNAIANGERHSVSASEIARFQQLRTNILSTEVKSKTFNYNNAPVGKNLPALR